MDISRIIEEARLELEKLVQAEIKSRKLTLAYLNKNNVLETQEID